MPRARRCDRACVSHEWTRQAPADGIPRIYCLQQWCGLADEALEDALYDRQALRDFVGNRSFARIGAGRHHAAQGPLLLTNALFDAINRI